MNSTEEPGAGTSLLILSGGCTPPAMRGEVARLAGQSGGRPKLDPAGKFHGEGRSFTTIRPAVV
jgi:hypothetical protein